MFDGLEMMLLCPCGLHLILAHHRYMWSFMFDIIARRGQEHLMADGFRQIDCHYLALQIES